MFEFIEIRQFFLIMKVEMMDSMFKKEEKRSRILNEFMESALEGGGVFIEKIKQRRGQNVYWHIPKITRYIGLYGIKNVMQAIKECMELWFYDKDSIKRLIKPQTEIKAPEGLIISKSDISRNLSCYKVETDELTQKIERSRLEN